MTHRVFGMHKAKSIYSDVMKTIKCAHVYALSLVLGEHAVGSNNNNA